MYKLMTGRAVLAGLLLAALVVAGCGTRVAERPGTSEPPAAKVSALQRVGQDGGWLLTDKNLLWEKGNAGSARTITPPGEAASDISAVSFLDPQDGWAATRARRSTNGSEVTVFRTSDGGSTWNSATVAAPPGVSGVASLDFVDASHGFLLANVESSSNFSFGELYGTDDAGATWAKLSAPSGGSMRFVTPSLGFIAGGPLNDKLYVTSDGGNSWRQRSVVLPEAFASAQTVYGVPTFATDRAGVLPVTLLPSGGSPAVAFYSTADGGASWKLAAVRLVSEAPAALGLGVRIPTDVLSLDSWVVAAPNGGRVFSTADGGRRWKEIAPNGLPTGVNDIDFGTLSDGWSVLAYGQCAGSKTDCTLTREARWTADGGQTWDVVRQ